MPRQASKMKRWFAAGFGTAIVSRSLLRQALILKFRRDVRALNSGNYQPLLNSYHRDAVLRFADGDHRWSGVHAGRDRIETFLQEFVDAGLQGAVTEAYFGGPLWRMTLLARFDDRALGPDGAVIYRNRTVLLVRTKWERSSSKRTTTRTPPESVTSTGGSAKSKPDEPVAQSWNDRRQD